MGVSFFRGYINRKSIKIYQLLAVFVCDTFVELKLTNQFDSNSSGVTYFKKSNLFWEYDIFYTIDFRKIGGIQA